MPEDAESLGVWNASLVGYWFSFHRPAVEVVHLDGLVNNEITELPNSDAHEDYLLEEVDAVGETRAERFANRHLGCEASLGDLRFCRVAESSEQLRP